MMAYYFSLLASFMMNNPNLTGISIQNLTTTIDLNPQPQMSRLNGMNYVLAPEPPSYSSLYPVFYSHLLTCVLKNI